ncbi:MAG: VCBS repeat-containing protein [Ferruginibacter sp.]|nr:VCBS repeat-containing protein [Ferruginibacter sp.]
MKYILITLMLLQLLGCRNKNDPMFTSLKEDETGIGFSNNITASDSMNIFNFEYIYNGGGAGAGDLNGDGLPDLFFAGNMVSSKLYINKGGFKFQDATALAGVSTQHWCTGVAMIDINQDERLDIYVTTAYPFKNKHSPNLLFINQGNDKNGIPVFKEAAAAVGLNDSAYGTQAAFFDYDLDGDLDMYLCNNAIREGNRNAIVPIRTDGNSASQDKLFRNDGTNSQTGLPHYTDVSKTAGILASGWGLGIIVKDINRDGWPDVYVANDFISNDHLYINNRNGTFSDQIGKYLAHECHNAMGVDMADCNNDGLEDICVVDMLPDDNVRQKTMFGGIPNDSYDQSLKLGYQPQFIRNVLQLNTGLIPDSIHNNFAFSDIGYMAGIAATDWSWSPLWADFDNDGWRDLLITNGYVKDITDLDFTTFMNEYSIFGDPTAKVNAIKKKARELGEVKKPNWLFINNHKLGFINRAAAAGLSEKTFTNGTVYADLDKDGDLDIVMNNLNDKALVYRNNTINENNIAGNRANNYLTINLKGNKGNFEGMGAKLSIWYNGQMQFAEQAFQRGYLSSMEGKMYFGLGTATMIDSIKIQWLYGKSQILLKVKSNQQITLEEENAVRISSIAPSIVTIFNEQTEQLLLSGYVHRENDFADFNHQFSLPHRYSRQGPALAAADVNGDGLEDVYVAGASRQSGYFLLQQRKGFLFKPANPAPALKSQEETGVLLFDADNDGDNDLYCVAGGNEFGDPVNYQDMLLLNDGKGNFSRDSAALPNTASSGSCIIGADYDHDGDIDLFVGGRIQPNHYPLSGRSYLLQNETDPVTKKIKFTDVTASVCKDLLQPGMVTTALWTDYDNDGFADLLLTGEFMPLLLFKNLNGKSFAAMDIDSFKNTNGWYNSLCAGDFDNDGDMDYVAGNLGLNSPYKASLDEPVTVRYNDFNKDGTMDAFLFKYNNHIEYPTHPRNVISDQIPAIKKRMLYFRDYGKAGYHDLFTAAERKGAKELPAFQMASVFLENLGGGKFKVTPLPMMAQIAPMFGITAADLDGDNDLDIIAVGNSYSPEALTGRYDASTGCVLRNDGTNRFSYMPPSTSGFAISGDAKALVRINSADNGYILLASRNQGPLKVFAGNKKQLCIPLNKNEVYVLYTMNNGRKRKEEFYYGNSYLSQSGRFAIMPDRYISVEIYDVNNNRRVFYPAASAKVNR